MTVAISPLRTIARALGGEVAGGQVLAPGPGHGLRDRSLSIKLSATAPLGFIVCSHAGDPFDVCQRHVAEKLGLDPDGWKKRNQDGPRRAREAHAPLANRPGQDNNERSAKVAAAGALWRASVDPRGTPVETYLHSRGLELGDELASEVLRWNENGYMIALFRSIATN